MTRHSLLLSAALLSVLAVSDAAAGRNQGAGAVAGGNTSGGNVQLEHCDAPMGTLAVVEDTNGDWYQYLTSDLRLPSTVPLLRMLIQQSNCFVVVERGRAMNNMMGERALQESGEMRSGSNFGRGQMVAADYTMNPTIQFSTSNAGGIGGFLSNFGSNARIAGALLGGLKFKKASTMLTLIDNRSGVQLAAAEGEGRKTDFGIGGFGGSGGLGGYTNTPEGKVLGAAFADAYNKMVVALRNYKAQNVEGGLGKGGKLDVGN